MLWLRRVAFHPSALLLSAVLWGCVWGIDTTYTDIHTYIYKAQLASLFLKMPIIP